MSAIRLIKNKSLMLLPVLGFLGVILPASANQPLYIDKVVAKVLVANSGLYARYKDQDARILTKHSAVYIHDRIITEEHTRAQIQFTDGTLVSLHPDTQFLIDDYAFTGDLEMDRFKPTLITGGLRLIPGEIAKRYHHHFSLKTDRALIGVIDGTLELAFNTDLSKMWVGAWSGQVTLKNIGGGMLLSPDGQFKFAMVRNSLLKAQGQDEVPVVFLNRKLPNPVTEEVAQAISQYRDRQNAKDKTATEEVKIKTLQADKKVAFFPFTSGPLEANFKGKGAMEFEHKGKHFNDQFQKQLIARDTGNYLQNQLHDATASADPLLTNEQFKAMRHAAFVQVFGQSDLSGFSFTDNKDVPDLFALKDINAANTIDAAHRSASTAVITQDNAQRINQTDLNEALSELAGSLSWGKWQSADPTGYMVKHQDDADYAKINSNLYWLTAMPSTLDMADKTKTYVYNQLEILMGGSEKSAFSKSQSNMVVRVNYSANTAEGEMRLLTTDNAQQWVMEMEGVRNGAMINMNLTSESQLLDQAVTNPIAIEGAVRGIVVGNAAQAIAGDFNASSLDNANHAQGVYVVSPRD